MWFPYLIAVLGTVGPAAGGASTLYIVQKLYEFYSQVSEFSESLPEIKQNQEKILLELQELKAQKEILVQEQEKVVKSFDYSSYITWTMLFKVSIAVGIVVGGVYCYQIFLNNSSDVLQGLQHLEKVQANNFITIQKSINNIPTIVNDTTLTIAKETSTHLSTIVNADTKILDETLQQVHKNILNVNDTMNSHNNETYKEILKTLHAIYNFLLKKGASENTNNNKPIQNREFIIADD